MAVCPLQGTKLLLEGPSVKQQEVNRKNVRKGHDPVHMLLGQHRRHRHPGPGRDPTWCSWARCKSESLVMTLGTVTG